MHDERLRTINGTSRRTFRFGEDKNISLFSWSNMFYLLSFALAYLFANTGFHDAFSPLLVACVVTWILAVLLRSVKPRDLDKAQAPWSTFFLNVISFGASRNTCVVETYEETRPCQLTLTPQGDGTWQMNWTAQERSLELVSTEEFDTLPESLDNEMDLRQDYPKDGLLTLRPDKVAWDITRDPSDPRTVFFRCTPRGATHPSQGQDADGHARHFTFAARVPRHLDKNKLERLPTLARSALPLDRAMAHALISWFLAECEGTDVHLPDLLREWVKPDARPRIERTHKAPAYAQSRS